jgi:hypothetical protein
MKKTFILLMFIFPIFGFSQQTKLWTEQDRTKLLELLAQTRNAIVNETNGLSPKQWNFKESPGRWSIKEITEHIAFWELLLQREISQGISAGLKPDLVEKAPTDSVVLGFITEEKPHISDDYTKPFTFSQPLGLNKGEDNVKWFVKMRNESIEYLSKTTDDLRMHFSRSNGNNIHQRFLTTYGHSFRHLRQIRKVKQHPSYPG